MNCQLANTCHVIMLCLSTVAGRMAVMGKSRYILTKTVYFTNLKLAEIIMIVCNSQQYRRRY